MGQVTPDTFEKTYMTDGEVLFRHRAVAPAKMFALLLLPGVVCLLLLLLAGMGGGRPPPMGVTVLLIVAPLLSVLVALISAVLRVAVTREHVHVQYGLWGPTIPMRAIARCEAVTYDWRKFGGWGARRARDGTRAFNMMGDQGRAVAITYRDERGAEQKVLISASQPAELVEAIERARSLPEAPPAALTRVEGIPETETELETEPAQNAERRARR